MCENNKYNGECITHAKGDNLDLEAHITDENWTDVDLTGATVIFSIKKNIQWAILLQQSITSHALPTQGKTKINFSGVQMNIDPWKYFYDLQVVNWWNKITTVVWIFTIIRGVTNG